MNNVVSQNFIPEEKVIENWIAGNDKLSCRNTVWSKLYKADVIKKVYANVPDNMSHGEDFIAFINLINCSKNFYCMENNYYNYRVRDDSISHVINKNYILRNNYLSFYIRDLIKSLNIKIDDNILDDWIFKREFSFLSQFFRHNGHFLSVYKIQDVRKFFGKNIVIYGAGNVGQSIYIHLAKYQKINIVAWVDKNYHACNFDYYDVESVSVLHRIKFDLVLVAVLKKTLADSIKNELAEMGVPEEKVVWEDFSLFGT